MWLARVKIDVLLILFQVISAYKDLLNDTISLYDVETQYYQLFNGSSQNDLHFKVTFVGKPTFLFFKYLYAIVNKVLLVLHGEI